MFIKTPLENSHSKELPLSKSTITFSPFLSFDVFIIINYFFTEHRLLSPVSLLETIVDEEEKEMINKIFLLDQTIAREIMIPRMDIVAFESQMSFKDIKSLIKKDGHSRYPVYEKTIDKILGLVYVKDLFNDPPEVGESFNLQRYIRKPLSYRNLKLSASFSKSLNPNDSI